MYVKGGRGFFPVFLLHCSGPEYNYVDLLCTGDEEGGCLGLFIDSGGDHAFTDQLLSGICGRLVLDILVILYPKAIEGTKGGYFLMIGVWGEVWR